jgi:signal transduction histidine kinase
VDIVLTLKFVIRVIQRLQGRSATRATHLQFVAVISVILGCGMAALGFWMDERMEDGVLHRAASETVLTMDAYIEPLVQELAAATTLSPAAQARLRATLAEITLGRALAAIKIWSTDGTIVYSTKASEIGWRPPIEEPLRRALSGKVVATFDDSGRQGQSHPATRLLEIHAPVRETSTNRIIAVAEFYEQRDLLRTELRNLHAQNAIIFGSLTVAMVVFLSSTMNRQRQQALQTRVEELTRLLEQNEDLQRRIKQAHHRMVETNELYLRRVGAELHDAPAQLIGFALLRFDTLTSQLTAPQADVALQGQAGAGPTDSLETIRSVLAEALREIRHISAGLAPPELDGISPGEAIQMAAVNHARRTGTPVRLDIDALPRCVDPSLNICLYRFAQEGLNNAWRHAGGKGQEVFAVVEDDVLTIEVGDRGNGEVDDGKIFQSGRLGLAGLRGRVEALGGTFAICRRPEGGTRLTARFMLQQQEVLHA